MEGAISPSANSQRVTRIVDIVFGALVMGTVGLLIGLLMEGGIAVPVSAAVGMVLGSVVGIFGGRRFLLSIVVGTALGGGLAWIVAGAETIPFGAGAGAAMGGFLGVQICMLLDMRAERKRQAVQPESPASGPT